MGTRSEPRPGIEDIVEYHMNIDEAYILLLMFLGLLTLSTVQQRQLSQVPNDLLG